MCLCVCVCVGGVAVYCNCTIPPHFFIYFFFFGQVVQRVRGSQKECKVLGIDNQSGTRNERIWVSTLVFPVYA